MIRLPKLTGGPAVLIYAFGARSILRLLSNLVLTRLLFPEVFGLMAVVGSVMYLIELSSDMGFKAFLIRHEKGDEPRYLDTIWTIRVIRGGIVAVLMGALAYPISVFYDSEVLFPILLFTMLTFIARGLLSVSLIQAERKQDLKKLAGVDLVAYIIQITATILLAFYFRSVWSLAIGALIGTISSVTFSYSVFEDSIRRFRIDRNVLKESWQFARVIVVASILSIVITQFDKFFIGKFLGMEILGIYAIAINLASGFINLIKTVGTRVIFPRLSKTYRQDPDNLKVSFYAERAKFVPFFLIGCGILLASGEALFQILFDQRYHQGGAYFALLMIKPVLMSMAIPAQHCLIAMGRVSAALVTNIMRTVWLIAVAFLGYGLFGIYGVILAVATVDLLPILYLWFRLAQFEILDLRLEAVNLVFIGTGLILGWILNLLIHASALNAYLEIS